MTDKYVTKDEKWNGWWSIVDTDSDEVVAQHMSPSMAKYVAMLLNCDATNRADDDDRKAMQAARDAHPGDMAAARAHYTRHMLTKLTKGEG